MEAEGEAVEEDEEDAVLDRLNHMKVETVQHCVLYIYRKLSEIGVLAHACEGDLILQSTNERIPYFNAPVSYLDVLLWSNQLLLRCF